MRTMIRAAFAAAMLSVVAAACTSSSGGASGALSCKLGGGCSPSVLCMGGIAGCSSNCQCLDGTWQAPCPADLPQTGSACTPASAECGYTTATNACGADNCTCQNGTWNCGPTCTTLLDSGAEGGLTPGAAACVAAGGQCVQGVAFCGPVGPGATAASCLDTGLTMLCCAVNPDGGCAEIQASNYDQSCTVDSDCVEVSVGNPCQACDFICNQSVGAINVGANAQYTADVAKTAAGVGDCGCPAEVGNRVGPCCRSGQCHADSACSSSDASTDSGDASGE
jgi:hypothetical protein